MTGRKPNKTMLTRLLASIHDLDRVIASRRTAIENARATLAKTQDDLDLARAEKSVQSERKSLDALKRSRKETSAQTARLRAEVIALKVNAESAVEKLEEAIGQVDAESNLLSDLRRSISERGFIDQIIASIFGDSVAAKIPALETYLSDKQRTAASRRTLLNDFQGACKSKQAELERAEQTLHNLERDSEREIARIEAAKEELARILTRLDVAKNKCTQIEKRALEISGQQWLASLTNLDQLCKRIRARQPQLDQLCPEALFQQTAMPDALAVGRLKVIGEDWRGHVPRLIPFPPRAGFTFPAAKPSEPSAVHELLLRMLTALPAGTLQITVCDPAQLGESVRPFVPMANEFFAFGKPLTRSDEIETALQNELDYVEEVLQRKFSGDVTGWQTFNQKNADRPLGYRVLVVFDAPNQLTDRSLQYLRGIAEHGPRAGVLPIVIFGEANSDNQKAQQSIDKIKQHLIPFESPSQSPTSGVMTHLSVTPEREGWPSVDNLESLLRSVASHYEQSRQSVREVADLWSGDAMWKECSIEKLTAPVGWDADGNVVSLTLNVNCFHGLLAGTTGSGKSNFLHVLIHSLCHRYSPTELQLYLLDYKQGTEMNAYAQMALPHASLVSTASDPEYGVTVLSHLVGEMERRAIAFKHVNVSELPEYRRKTGEKMPRLVLIVDEFQVLFSGRRSIADAAETLLDTLLRQGRSHGIHILFSTQTLRGIKTNSSSSLLANVQLRICLRCSEDESVQILSSGNNEGGKLTRRGEAILNEFGGTKSENQRVQIAFASPHDRETHACHIKEQAQKDNVKFIPLIFDGARLPRLPSLDSFLELRMPSQTPRLCLGEELQFGSPRLIADLSQRYGVHLLCVGLDQEIQDGLISSVILSVFANTDFQHFVYLNGQFTHRRLRQDVQTLVDGERCSIWNAGDDALTFSNLPSIDRDRFGVLLVDGFDNAKVLHESGGGFRVRPANAPTTLADSFAELVGQNAKQGWFVVTVADNWKLLSRSMKQDVLAQFRLRIGFMLTEDDAGACAYGNISRMRESRQPGRAFIVDPRQAEPTWFRPFDAGGDDVD